MSIEDVRLLEEKHVMHILDFIGRNPDCMKTEIYDAVSHNPRMPDKLRKLEDAGLIIPKGTDNCTRYTLTDDGTHIRNLIMQISEVFGNNRTSRTVI